MFIKRPKKTDSEDELLLMQQNFLSSGNSCVAEKVTEKAPEALPKPINKVKKTSIFAQKHLNSSLNKAHCKSEELKQDVNGNKFSHENNSSVSNPMLQDLPSTSEEPLTISPGEGVMNLFEKVIAEHSVEELLEEMKQLQSRFGPETIAFLKNRSKGKPHELDASSTSTFSKETSGQSNKDHKILCKNETYKGRRDVVTLHEDGNESNVTNAGEKGHEFTSTTKLQSKVSTRFGLYGEIIIDGNYSSELYHHEEEPERGGYTLQEIFLLIRSSFNQQQDFGLKMLSCVVKQAKLGSFHGRLSNGIIPVLVGGDVGLLARAALDSSAQSVIISAVEFLHALLVNSEDESALDHVFSWFRGYEQPVMNATSEDLTVVEDVDTNQTNGNNLKVEDVFKKDMIEGLLRMILLPRISYLLNFFHLQNAVVNNLLDIVIRIYRHHPLHHEHGSSPYTLNYQQLTDSLVKEFLPLQDGYLACGRIVSQSKVVRLLRVLASSDVNVANYMLKKYADNIFQYLQRDTSPSCLYYESLRFFIVLLRYGLAYEKFKIFMGFIVTRLHALSKLPEVMYSTNEAALLLSFAEAGINLSPGDNQKESHMTLPDESYQEFSELVSLIITICKKCIDDFMSQYYLQKYSTSSVLASSLNCIATCFAKFHHKLAAEASEFVARTLEPCLDSMSFERAVSFLRINSSIVTGAELLESLGESCASFKSLESLWVDPSHVLESLPDDRLPKTLTKKLVSSHLEMHQVTLIPPTRSSTSPQCFSPSPLSPPSIKWHPVVNPLSTASFLVAITRAVLVLADPCFGNRGILKMKVLKHHEIQLYLSKFISACNISVLSRNWFSRSEAHFLYFLIRMAKQLTGSLEHKSHIDAVFYHKVALNLLTFLHQGDEAIVSELLHDVIFSKDFFSDVFDCPETNLTQNFQSSFIIDTNRSPLIDFGSDVFNNLSNMGSAYVQLFFSEDVVASSRNSLNGCRMNCMMVGVCDKMVMRCDWLLEPLRHLYGLHNQSKKNPELYAVVKNLEELCSHSVRAALLFEKCRPEVLHHIPTQLKFARLIQAVVAAGKELENGVTYSYLDQLVEVYIRGQKKHGKVEQTFFKELYDSFLEVYLRYLGGIPVFDVMVLLPLFLFDDDVGSLWQLLWLTRAEAARYLFLPLSQLPCNINMLLKSKDGNNISLIKIFYHSLKIKWFTPTKTPIPYLVAIHYLNQFLFSSIETAECDKRWRRLYAQEINNWEEPVRAHVLFYKQMDLGCDIGFKLYEALPDSRQKQLMKLITIL